MPYECNFQRSFEWFTLSNASEKFRRYVCLPRLDLRARSSISETNWVSQEHLSQKLCCRSYISLFEFRCLTTLEAIICSSTLHKMHVRERVGNLQQLIRHLFLYMGETLAEFHICGTGLDSIERSNRIFRIGTNSDLNSCNMTGLILSGPAALLGLRFFRSFSKSASEILISVITVFGFLRLSGSSVGVMALSSARSCIFISERSPQKVGTGE